ncbi:unnamed protein product [Dracunculus medinensis]|uniref:Signal recognition particle receptor subunit alpha homolog n=1 Tax=Dracunculus medinensis TaxID=318479 RepID=A0A158Q4I1_DRAME|nr:unnamed protein product [Dracunculus medinensis]
MAVLIKSIKDRLIRWKEFFEAKLNHEAPSVAPDIADTYFIDFPAAFDSIDRTALWRVMECDGVPEKIIRLIKAFYEQVPDVPDFKYLGSTLIPNGQTKDFERIGHRVLIAAGDTFRAGAVEQLRTHTKHLNALHPNSVQLYEQGYGKDPAGLTAAAIAIAAERKIDVVLVDTAGRMQDNEPLMRSLVKQIRINKPDLVLFVGEALVGNEAVDQLVKFNQALADFASVDSEVRLIDGIILTKFDTIDDKVGAAVSMTYITGQPIVFVGTGQTYKDLKSLNINAVVNSLLK